MRRSTVAVLTAALISAILTSMPPAAGGPPGGRDPRIVKAGAMAAPKGDFVPGELVVSFRPGLERAQSRAVHARLGATVVERIAGLRTDVVKLPPGAPVQAAARAYGRRPEVAAAEPNWLIYPTFIPDDASYAGQQWDFNNTGQAHDISDPVPGTTTHAGTADADIAAEQAWETETGDPGTVIAVIDSGVDVNHPDLQANIWVNTDEIPGNNIDDDGNGYKDDIHGRDTAQDDNNLLDGSSTFGYDHGTHVAGTIAAVTNNATGVAGVCGGDGSTPGCSIMVLKFMRPFAIPGGGFVMGGTLEAELEAIEYAKRNGADIINGSYGSPAWSRAERNAFKRAPGILAVLAAGNDALDNDMAASGTHPRIGPISSPLYPASYNLPNIISVAASNHQDRYGFDTGCATRRPVRICEFSSFGRHSVDLAAPGVDILSTVPTAGPDYDTFNGTSMAAPHVAGVAGLLESETLSLTSQNLKNIIMNSVDTTGLPLNSKLNFLPFRKPQTGKFTRTAGRLNAEKALTNPDPRDATPNHDGDIPGAARIAGRRRGSVSWPNDVNDIYKRKLRRGESYRFTLAVPKGKDYDLYLLKPGTLEVWQPFRAARASLGGPGVDETFTFTAKEAKIHFVHVSSWFSDGRYAVRIRCLTC
jgi:subtilisin family serine protease